MGISIREKEKAVCTQKEAKLLALQNTTWQHDAYVQFKTDMCICE